MTDHRGDRDFDLHGVVGIRLVDATLDDVATVSRQLGPLRTRLGREPDITIRFVDRATTEPLTYVGLGETGYNRDNFFLLQGKGGVRGGAAVPFSDIGRRPQIVCERSIRAVPHLLAIVNLTALSKGVLPLHASAFNIGSRGVLVTGWAKGGKTESLLGSMWAGAEYVGDEWVYLTPDRRMLGLPEPIRLWAWHLEQMPALLKARSRSERTRLAAWRRLSTLARSASTARLPGSGVAGKAVAVLERQAYLQIPPAELFGPNRLALSGSLESVVLVVSHSEPQITVARTGPTEVSERMAASLAEERAAFLTHYRQFRFAFPDRRSDAVDTAEATEARLLSRLFDGRAATKIAHPYPCDIAALGAAVRSAASEVTAAFPATLSEEVALS